jgi:two-component system KDP operon response regulator KdpE
MSKKERVLVVDDEPRLVTLVREILNATGYEVSAASSGLHAIEAVAIDNPALVLLDIMLVGGIDGFEVARRIRQFSAVPIIMLTAKVTESDLLKGFEAGADDYITKPFSSKELLARIRAVLKRSQDEKENASDALIVCGLLRIELARRRVTLEGHEIKLTSTEYRLLHELVIHRNQVMLHEQLLTSIWGEEYRGDLEYLRTYIRHLRAKLEVDPTHPKLIVRSRGVGYMFVCPESGNIKTPGMDHRIPIS